jgi:hypothetical protein
MQHDNRFLTVLCGFLALITCNTGVRAEAGSAALVSKVLAVMPVIDGHNDLPWEIRERFAIDKK